MSEHSLGLDAVRLTQLRRVSSVVPSPCGTWLAVEMAELNEEQSRYIPQLWKVWMDGSHEPLRLTRGPSSNKAPCFRQDGSLGFLSNRDTDEDKSAGPNPRFQVWVLPAMGGEPQPITDEPLGVLSFQFAKAANRLVVLTPVLPNVAHEKQRSTWEDRQKNGPSALHYKAMPVRSWDHWIDEPGPHVISFDGQGNERRDLTPDAGHEHLQANWDLSQDGSTVVVTSRTPLMEDHLPAQSLLFLELDSGGQRYLEHQPTVILDQPCFSPDGTQLACLRRTRTSEPAHDVSLWLMTLATGEEREVAARWDRWASTLLWSDNGDSLFVTADDDGDTPVFQVNFATDRVQRVTTQDSGGSHGSLSTLPHSPSLVGFRHTVFHPPEPFVVDAVPDATPRLLANLSGFSPEEGEAIARIERHHAPSDDGTEIQSFLLTPQAEEGPHPWLLWIHGGPINQWSDGWHWRWNPLVLVSQGIAIAQPNPRGSTGRGQAFIAEIWGNAWGEQCYRDLMYVTEALTQHDHLDSQRYGAMGGSFGGYMTNWLAGHTDRFRCMITHASIVHFSMFHGTTDVPGWFAMDMDCDPYAATDALEKDSPHKFLADWKTPTLIIHGEKDYRVPISEALYLFTALQRKGVHSELLVFPDENHWILKPRNIRAWYQSVSQFAKQHLAKKILRPTAV